MRVSCSLVIAATRATGIAVANSISNASNSNVNPDSGRAQTTSTRCTPCSGQRVRGTRACRNALYWKKSKCRHVVGGGVGEHHLVAADGEVGGDVVPAVLAAAEVDAAQVRGDVHGGAGRPVVLGAPVQGRPDVAVVGDPGPQAPSTCGVMVTSTHIAAALAQDNRRTTSERPLWRRIR